MKLQGLNFPLAAIVMVSLVGCASTPMVPTNKDAAKDAGAVDPTLSTAPGQEAATAKTGDNTYLICKASRSRFHYDWSAEAIAKTEELKEQNSIRYEFRSARKPAGARGENLKVGECGWAEEALAPRGAGKRTKTPRSQVVFKSLSDEATQTFYKMRTGKVFKVPVRHTKNGLVAAPGGVSVIR